MDSQAEVHLAALAKKGPVSEEEKAAVQEALRAVESPTLKSLLGKRAADCAPDSTSSSSIVPEGVPHPLGEDAIVGRDALSPEDAARWTKLGHDALRADSVATLLFAGGQGTRLGYAGPKGGYVLSELESAPSLFQLFAERLQRLATLASSPVPRLYVMTSAATDAPIRALFKEHKNWGLADDRVFFFAQGSLPAFDAATGDLLWASRTGLALAPNGNGGVYAALAESGALADMEANGVTHLAQIAVDNCLALPIDPMFVGLMAETGADVGSKIVTRKDADEKVGVFGLKEDKVCVIEYSELTVEQASDRQEDGQLVWRACHICINSFTTDFLRRAATAALPFHEAHKKVPTWEESTPGAPNGIKYERFVFDAFAACERFVALEIRRSDEFAALKNAEGRDSPVTCVAALRERSKRWLEEAGAIVTGPVDVPPTVSLAGEGLEWAKGKNISGLVSKPVE
jgi:UDP-N-acetylglucosamine/UDP-N-acetylgalactosamine diphosphorylase